LKDGRRRDTVSHELCSEGVDVKSLVLRLLSSIRALESGRLEQVADDEPFARSEAELQEHRRLAEVGADLQRVTRDALSALVGQEPVDEPEVLSREPPGHLVEATEVVGGRR
jgi:hypothetical protein